MEIPKQPDIDAEVAIPAIELRPVSIFEQININIFWLANQFHWNAIMAVILPSMVAKLLDPSLKDLNLTLVVVWGTLVATVVNPLTGALSDYATFRMGRRRPFMIIGTIFNIIALVAFAFSPYINPGLLVPTFALLFVLLQLSNNIANSPWSAIIADKVPPGQRGITAGINGICLLLGTALGSVVAGLIVNKKDPLDVYKQDITWIFLLIAVVQIALVIYTILTVKETPLAPGARGGFRLGSFARKFFFKPSHYPDLCWVLLTRLLMQMGIWTIFYFLQYYADDVLKVSGEQFIGGAFLPILLVASLPTSLLAGWASDRWGRKGMIYLSGFVMALVCLIFIFFQSPFIALIAAALFGIGYGANSSVDWALVTDTLPPTDEAGKFLGLWSAMGILPQVIGICIGGILLQALHNTPNNFGYTILFLVTTIYFALGTILIYQVKGVK